MNQSNSNLSRRQIVAAIGAFGASAMVSTTARAATAANDTGDLLIGQSAHLSGPLAPTFLPVVRGQELALEQINKRGGVHGRGREFGSLMMVENFR